METRIRQLENGRFVAEVKGWRKWKPIHVCGHFVWSWGVCAYKDVMHDSEQEAQKCESEYRSSHGELIRK